MDLSKMLMRNSDNSFATWIGQLKQFQMSKNNQKWSLVLSGTFLSGMKC